MVRHKRSELNKQAGIPLEQIKYDPALIRERLKKIKKKRAIVNNSLTAVSFVLVIAAIVLLVLYFVSGNAVNFNEERILVNLQGLFIKNRKIIAANARTNLISLKGVAVTTFFSLILPNFLYLSTGINEFIDRMGTNIYLKQGIKHLRECIVTNGAAIGNCFQQLISDIQKNFAPISHGFQKIVVEIWAKIQQIRN